MQIIRVNSTTPIFSSAQNKKSDYVKLSGFGSLGFGLASIVAIKSKKIKTHKILAYLSGVLALLHIGFVEYNHYRYSQQKKVKI